MPAGSCHDGCRTGTPCTCGHPKIAHWALGEYGPECGYLGCQCKGMVCSGCARAAPSSSVRVKPTYLESVARRKRLGRIRYLASKAQARAEPGGFGYGWLLHDLAGVCASDPWDLMEFARSASETRLMARALDKVTDAGD